MGALRPQRQGRKLPLQAAAADESAISNGNAAGGFDPEIAAALADVVLLVREQGTIDWASTTCRDVIGWEPRDLVGVFWDTLVHPADVERVRASWHVGDIAGTKIELRLRRHDGDYRWFRVVSRSLPERYGTPMHLLGLQDIHRDVAQRERHRLSEIRMRKVFDEIPDPVSEWQPIYNECDRLVDLRAIRTNRAFDNGFGGYSMEGRLASAFVPTVPTALLPIFEEALRNHEDRVTRTNRGDRQFDLHISVTEHATVMVVARELHEQQPDSATDLAADAERIAGQQLHLARMAHTLRTNLSVVQGWAEMLDDSVLEDDPELARDAVTRIARSAKQALQTVSALMDAATDSDGYRVDVQPVAIAPIIETAISDFVAESGRIQISTDLEAGLAARANAEAIDVVLRHLIENALKFADSMVHISARKNGSQAEFFIKDDGSGIPSDVELFAPFTPNHHGEGHGLGLNVVAKLVDAMHGTVEGHNCANGSGAEFVLRLPAA